MSILINENALIQGPISEIRLREIALLMAEGTLRDYGEETLEAQRELFVEEAAQVTGISKQEATLFFDAVRSRAFRKNQKQETAS